MRRLCGAPSNVATDTKVVEVMNDDGVTLCALMRGALCVSFVEY